MPDPRRRYQWDAAAAQYRAPNGRFVSRAAIRAALDQAIVAEQRAMTRTLALLRNGSLSLDGWYAAMRQSVKLVHMWAAAAAKGGWAQLSPTDYGTVGGLVRFHYGRLSAFAEQIAARLPLDGRAEVRVKMYAQAARNTYHGIELGVVTQAGYTQERNILDPAAESCAECIELTALDWVPVGTNPRPGNRLCLVGCRCRLEFRIPPP